MTVMIDTTPLSVEAVVDVARNRTPIQVSDAVRARLVATREFIDAHWMRDDAPLVYAFNTGVGLFKDRRVALADMDAFQQNLLLSHATGLGEPMTEDESRALMLLRLNAFKGDASGVSLPVVDRLVDFLNAGLAPVVPQQGSVGASGDLAPLAHCAGALLGLAEAEILYRGERLPAPEAIARAGLAPSLELLAKDASALINGSTASLALAVLAIHDAQRIARHADVSLALSLEAMRCEKAAFHPALHAARPHPGQVQVAANVLRLVGDSKRMGEAARECLFPQEARAAGQSPPPRVQDVYSLRCAPQVHGPVREAIGYARGILDREIESATDNPLIIDVDGERTAISGGHFHGQYVAQASDLLALSMADLGSVCERRVARLIDPGMSYGLPRNLTAGRAGLHTGYATVQCSLTSLVMENRTLATPGSVDSVPAKGNAEDHVSNSMWCARKLRRVVRNVQAIVATETLLAGQALALVEDIAAEFPLGTGSAAALAALRERVPARLDGDLWFATDMQVAIDLLDGEALLEACAASGAEVS